MINQKQSAYQKFSSLYTKRKQILQIVAGEGEHMNVNDLQTFLFRRLYKVTLVMPLERCRETALAVRK